MGAAMVPHGWVLLGAAFLLTRGGEASSQGDFAIDRQFEFEGTHSSLSLSLKRSSLEV